MALRLFLLALVGLMSFELPSERDVSSWTEGGSRWVNARLASLSDLKTEVERAFIGVSQPDPANEPASPPDSLTAEIASMRADLAFETAMDGLARNFRTDLASIQAALPVAEEAPIAVDTVDTLGITVEQVEPRCFDPETEASRPSSLGVFVDPNPSADRLSSAVRLTREALSAWASLIEGNQEDSR
jgi:hypothetical protein